MDIKTPIYIFSFSLSLCVEHQTYGDRTREIVTRRNTVGALLTLNMELNKKSPPGNGDSKGGFRATQRC